MNNLSEKMQERLNLWRNKTVASPTPSRSSSTRNVRCGGKGDYGDALSLDDLEYEAKRSQTRK